MKFSVMSAISVPWLDASWGAVYTRPYYGLMQHSFIEIKNKLLRALDAEYNVVDMGTVFEVLAVLEKTPITTEVLETTRLGRVINECRRRTNNEVLAKRAKHLLRNWRNLIDPNNSSVLSPSASIPSSLPAAVLNGNVYKSASYANKADRLPTPSISPALSTSSSHSRNSGGGGNVYDSKISPACSLSPVGEPPKVESVPKTHVANKRLRKNASSVVSPGEPPAKKSKVNGKIASSSSSSSERCTTSANEELFDSGIDSVLSRVSELTPVTEDRTQEAEATASLMEVDSGSETVTTRIVPEPDPPLPKRRNRKKTSKKKSQADDIVKEKLVALSKTGRVKTTEELVADLKSRTVSGGADDSVGLISVKPSLSNNVSTDCVCDTATTTTIASGAISTKKKREASKLDPESRVEYEIQQILSKLPPVNVNEIVWDSPEPSTPPTPKPITDEDVDRYLQQDWEGVNGCVTELPPTMTSSSSSSTNDDGTEKRSCFRGWHEMVARKTTDDTLIHILPYSIVD